MADSEKRSLPTWMPIMLSTFTTVIAIVTFVVTVNPWAPVGPVTPPVGVAIVRGIDPHFAGEPRPGEGVSVGLWPSDHLVVPLEWRNDTGSALLIQQPTLILHKINRSGQATGDQVNFFMINELADTNAGTLVNINKEPLTYSNTVYVQPHSIVRSVTLFRVEDWAGRNRCFRFHQGESYRVEIQYRRVPDAPIWHQNPKTETLIERLTMLESVNWLSPYGEGSSMGWDFFTLLPGSRAANGMLIPEKTEKYYTEPPECH
jgi:hypothetical protein